MLARWIRRLWVAVMKVCTVVAGLWITVTYNPRRRLIAAMTAVVLIAGVTVGAITLANQSDECPAGYYRGSLHECIGVTDGGYDFIPGLHDVDQAIWAQNRYAVQTAAQQNGQVVTVALLLPLTSTDPSMQIEILHAVQGAYVAQYRENEDADGVEPYIRLVLANPGADSTQFPPVVQQLQAMTGEPDNLRVVASISVSTSTTIQEVHGLADANIPVVGGAITGNDIANTAKDPYLYPGLARIEPNNEEEASALSQYVSQSVGKVNKQQAVLVEDTREGDSPDDYISTLAAAFAGDSAYAAYQFDSPNNEDLVGDTANTFDTTVQQICNIANSRHVKWIYFAGRQVQLTVFINALASACPGTNFTILTGSAASHLSNMTSTSEESPGEPVLDTSAFSKGIALEYAAIAAPGMSAPGYPAFSGTISAAAGTGKGKIGVVSLADGQAIINYDAVLTAIKGIRQQTSPKNPLPTLPEIGESWGQLSGPYDVPGASGLICLENDGNPYDKLVPIVKYSVNGTPVPVGPAWPTGTALTSPCVVPRGAG